MDTRDVRTLRRGPARLPDEVAEYVAELSLQQAIGLQVTGLRTAAGLSQNALAQRAGVDVTVVRQIERGTPDPVTLLPFRSIATALGTTLAALFDTPPPHPGPRTARPVHVLTPTGPLDSDQAEAGVWRLSKYAAHDIGQRAEPGHRAEPGRTVPAPILDWASDLLRVRVVLLGSASELTGRRSWYIGPLHRLEAGRP